MTSENQNEQSSDRLHGTEKHLRVQYEIVNVLASPLDLQEASSRVLEIICRHMGWDVGIIWRVDVLNNLLVCLNIWHLPAFAIGEFEKICWKIRYPKGQGIPGTVWQANAYVWNDDVTRDSGFLRLPTAKQYGLHAGFGFPIVLAGEVVGVIELFRRDRCPLDNELLQLLEATSGQLGQFMERVTAQQALKAAQQREDFTATITHDLKGPLMGVNRVLELISDGKLGDVSDQQRQLLLQVIDTNKGCLSLIQDMLDVFRYEKNINSISLIETDIRDIIRSSVIDLSPLAANRGITIKLDMPKEFKSVAVDQTAIRRVLQNLIDNAIKFSQAGREVLIKAWIADEKINVSVKDHGPGISQEDSGKLFERCFQGEAGRSSSRGMGLGLYLCKQIVDAHRGEIRCDSEVNVGSTFTVTLPDAPIVF